jgi:hypothetical protein
MILPCGSEFEPFFEWVRFETLLRKPHNSNQVPKGTLKISNFQTQKGKLNRISRPKGFNPHLQGNVGTL